MCVFQIHLYSFVHVGMYKVGSKQVCLCYFCFFIADDSKGRLAGWLGIWMGHVLQNGKFQHTWPHHSATARAIFHTRASTRTHTYNSHKRACTHMYSLKWTHTYTMSLHIHTRVHAMTYSIAVPTKQTPWYKNSYTHFSVFLCHECMYMQIYTYISI